MFLAFSVWIQTKCHPITTYQCVSISKSPNPVHLIKSSRASPRFSILDLLYDRNRLKRVLLPKKSMHSSELREEWVLLVVVLSNSVFTLTLLNCSIATGIIVESARKSLC